MPFLSRLFGRPEPSGKVASERIRRVLVQYRASVSPQTMERMRANLTRVLSEFMDVDEQNSVITITDTGGAVSLVATVPIRRMKRGKR